jgi:hypothetical protein
MEIIISDTRGYYESIHTEEAMCILALKIKYAFKGYRVWSIPTIWMSGLWFNITGRRIYKGRNITFEKRIPGSDQVTYWQPWMNFH